MSFKANKTQLSSKEELLSEMKNSTATIKVMLGAGDIGQMVSGIQKGLLSEN